MNKTGNKIGRFPVMAVLQAARARELGYSLDEAKSFGLNRAIFYAAAKQGFKKNGHKAYLKSQNRHRTIHTATQLKEEFIGNEKAYYRTVKGKKIFVMGGTLLTPAAFNRQIAEKFNGRFQKVWTEAGRIISHVSKHLLESQQAFYEHVYKPQRDDLAAKWSELATA